MNLSNQYYATAIILIIYWTIGLFALNAGILIYALLVFAVLAITIKIIQIIKGMNNNNISHTDLSAKL